jgi:RNA polymerase sigma factor (sigma-70 family)
MTGDVSETSRRVIAVEPSTTEHGSALREIFLEALAQLSPQAVEILILRYEHHYSDAEIAKLLGTSRGSIAVRLYRARIGPSSIAPASQGTSTLR